MKHHWGKVTVRDLVNCKEAEIKTGPFGTQLHASDYVDQGTPVINARNIGFGDIRDEKLEYISDETVQRLSSHLLRASDIVFGRKGTVERHSFIKDKHENWFQGTDCLRLRINSERIIPRFVSYFLLTENHKQWIINQSSHGATMTSLNQDIIGRLTLPLPPKDTQQKVVAVLSAYDDLIENNTRRIEILEEMAQAIYREWFVHFRYPGHEGVRLVESEMGEIPEGWENRFADFVDFLEGPGLRNWQYRGSGIPFLNIRTLIPNDIDFTKIQFIEEEEVTKRYSHFLLEPFDHVVSSSGTIGRIVTIRSDHLPLMLNTSIIRMRPKSDCVV